MGRLTASLDVATERTALAGAIADPAVRVVTFDDAQPGLRRLFGQVTTYLGLVGLTSLLVGGIGVAASVHTFVGTRLGTDDEDVHQMRVTMRRLRAFLRTARPMLALDWAESLRIELQWLGGMLGLVRVRDLAQGKEIRSFAITSTADIAFSPDGKTLASASHDKTGS